VIAKQDFGGFSRRRVQPAAIDLQDGAA